MSPKIYSVIVTYNPDLLKLGAVLTAHINTKCTGIIVIDNNSEAKEGLMSAINTINNACIKTIILDNNTGIGYAQNHGIKLAKTLGADYVALFDQDSIVPPDIISVLLKEHEHLSSNGIKIGAIGPECYDPDNNKAYPQIRLNGFKITKLWPDASQNENIEVSFIIASGSFINIKTFDDVGLMNEELFIDWVDIEWCLRAASKGYHFFVTSKTTMAHTIGDKRVKSLGRDISIHSPIRKYYMLRNKLLLCRLSWVPRGFKMRLLTVTFFSTLVYLYDVRFDRKYMRYAFKGIYDGILNRSGALKS